MGYYAVQDLFQYIYICIIIIILLVTCIHLFYTKKQSIVRQFLYSFNSANSIIDIYTFKNFPNIKYNTHNGVFVDPSYI